MSKLFIPVLAGTTREQRKSIHAARLVQDVLAKHPEVETQLVDPLDFSFPHDGNDPESKDPRYTEITARADAFFIVTPEYNHSMPGSLKRMLDSELENYIHKPVAFAGVSSGPWGGVRGIEALVTAVREMGMIATFTDVQFPKIQSLFNDQGELQDDAYPARIQKSIDELVWMAMVLKSGRETVPSKYHSKQ